MIPSILNGLPVMVKDAVMMLPLTCMVGAASCMCWRSPSAPFLYFAVQRISFLDYLSSSIFPSMLSRILAAWRCHHHVYIFVLHLTWLLAKFEYMTHCYFLAKMVHWSADYINLSKHHSSQRCIAIWDKWEYVLKIKKLFQFGTTLTTFSESQIFLLINVHFNNSAWSK